MNTMLSLFMMSLLIFCITAENPIEPQASLTSKVRFILLIYVRVATINYFLKCNYFRRYRSREMYSCLMLSMAKPIMSHALKQLGNRSKISIQFFC